MRGATVQSTVSVLAMNCAVAAEGILLSMISCLEREQTVTTDKTILVLVAFPV